MDNLLFFLKDKNRLKFLLKCILIGMPVLFLLGWAVNYFEDKEAEKGTANDKGGLTYFYRDGTSGKLPEPVAKLIELYPGSKITYISVSTDKQKELEGDIYAFTPDALSKVLAFYKSKAKLIKLTDKRLEMEQNGQNIVVEEERAYEDDEIQGETKYRIAFYNKATVNKWKNYKP